MARTGQLHGWACALTLCGACAASSGAGDLQREVEALVRAKALGQARTGVVILDAQRGGTLASLRPDEGFMPASNMKVLTTGAAMLELGHDFEFVTELVLEGTRLVIRGSGDPALGDPEVLKLSQPKMSVGQLVDALADAPRLAGVQSLSEVIVDDRIFDRQWLHPSWNPDNFDEAYSAEVCGFNFHANLIAAYPSPGSGRGQPTVTLDPPAPWIVIDTSRSRSVGEGRNTCWLLRTPLPECSRAPLIEPVAIDALDARACNSFSLRGDVRMSPQAPILVPARSAPLHFGAVLAHAIENRGVALTGASAGGELPAGVRLAREGEDLTGGRVVARVHTPLREVITRCNADSENLYAECILKRIGHHATGQRGNWSNGAGALRASVERLLGQGAADGLVVSDGSGLSRQNRVSPMLLARWLDVCAEQPWGEAFIASMAAPGTGTLEKRFRDKKLTCEVRAKSGFINGVRSLCGYVTHPESGERAVFAILINDLPAGSNQTTSNARELHEEIVDLIDDMLEKRSAKIRVGG